ncbi:MAG: hypothetical protein J2P55_12675 [Rhizobiales bacterium]|nr:hypothetical protein [Hyphomicrobiales bacterium]
MAGTINLALTQQLDEFGNPLSGGQLFIIQAGTVSTPQNPYQDTALSIVMPNPITLDGAGRIPQFFLADGQIKVRLQDKYGVIKFQQDNLLVIGPSAGGGGGGGSVDPTTVMQTGDMSIKYDTAIRAGFVSCIGKTIGNASSGASELADPSAQALFLFLWQKDPTLTVAPGGRGANAAADYAANKTITLPDGRNRLLMALGDMGNSDIGYLANNTFTKGNGTTLGSLLGAAIRTLTAAQIPAISSSGNNNITVNVTSSLGGAAQICYSPSGGIDYFAPSSGGGGIYNLARSPGGFGGVSSISGSGTTVNGIGVTSNNTGGQFHEIANPIMLITVYLKL